VCVLFTICAYPLVVDFVAERIVINLLLSCDSEGVFCVDGKVPNLIQILENRYNTFAIFFINLNLFAIVIEALSLRSLSGGSVCGTLLCGACSGRPAVHRASQHDQLTRLVEPGPDGSASRSSPPPSLPPASAPPSPPPEPDFEAKESVPNPDLAERSGEHSRLPMARISIAEAQTIMRTVQEENELSVVVPASPNHVRAPELVAKPAGCSGRLSCGLRFDDFYVKILDTMIGSLILAFVLMFTVLPTKFFQSVLLYNRSFAQLLGDVARRRSLIQRLLLS